MKTLTKKFVKVAGGPSRVANHFGITVQAVSKWKQIPVDKLEGMCELTGLTPQELRPDLKHLFCHNSNARKGN